ncbi:unnamed protein product [Clonostachys byssicola]|uniref:F-box domain-containing protein n=1 Tax=Clonostachys byssicola TaxID=160290 RepID=A0A9N9YA57_9HYPO|nr:unnamed protein product [Clonostachys byssicola]
MGTRKRKRARPRRKRDYFSDTPAEIIDHVMSFVPRSGLINLCLVNKSLRSYAEPFLYSTVVFEYAENWQPPIINLLQTLLRRPELLAYIRTLALGGNDRAETKLYSLKPIGYRVQSYMPIIERLRLPVTNLWVRRLREAHVDAFAALLIAQAPNIRRLTIADNWLRSPDLLTQLLRHGALGQPPMWKRLEQLVFFAPFVVQTPDVAMTTFYLSTVTDLAVSLGDMQVLPWPTAEPDLDHLISLDVTLRDVMSNCATMVAGLLARTRCLKSLYLEWEYYPDATGMDFEEIVPALPPVKATLESLRLRMEFSRHWRLRDDPNMTPNGSLGSLLDFDRITRFEVPLVALAGCGVDAKSLIPSIPRNVEELSLSTDLIYENVKWLPDLSNHGPHESIVSVIEESFRHYRTSLPRLRCIKIIDTVNGFKGGRIERLLEETSPVDGIDIEIVRDMLSPWRENLDDLWDAFWK